MKSVSRILVFVILACGAAALAQVALPLPQSVVPGNGIMIVNGPVPNQGIVSSAAVQLGTPASSAAACLPTSVLVDSSYVYVCVGPNHWLRAPLSGF